METYIDIRFRREITDLLGYFNLSGDAVEIGNAEGRFAEILIKSPNIIKFYMIDAWKQLNQKGDGHMPNEWHQNNYREALERTNAFSEKRIILQGLSSERIKDIPDDSLILAYIDADHSYNGCIRDLRAIWPKLKNGSILAGHDYLNENYGVRSAVLDFVKEVDFVDKEIHIIPEDHESNASFWIRKL